MGHFNRFVDRPRARLMDSSVSQGACPFHFFFVCNNIKVIKLKTKPLSIILWSNNNKNCALTRNEIKCRSYFICFEEVLELLGPCRDRSWKYSLHATYSNVMKFSFEGIFQKESEVLLSMRLSKDTLLRLKKLLEFIELNLLRLVRYLKVHNSENPKSKNEHF